MCLWSFAEQPEQRRVHWLGKKGGDGRRENEIKQAGKNITVLSTATDLAVFYSRNKTYAVFARLEGSTKMHTSIQTLLFISQQF